MSDMSIALLRSLHRDMLRIRLTEEEIVRRFWDDGQSMRCPIHLCIGQEAVAVGVCAQLEVRDGVFGAHRSHGHYLAKGGDLDALVAELHGRVEGCCAGRGGSMHLIDRRAGFMGATPIVGATVPLAVGAAWAEQRRGTGAIAVVFFGDGCFEEGVLHESMNFAVLKKIPVLFVCENNRCAVYTGLGERQPDRSLGGVARAHGLNVHEADGNDVEAVWEATRQAVAQAREGDGPSFLEFFTYRVLEHCGPNNDDALGYRDLDEIALWRDRCPVGLTERRLRERGIAGETLAAVRRELAAEVEAAFIRGRNGTHPDAAQAVLGVFAPVAALPAAAPPMIRERPLTYVQAIREATLQAMTACPEVFIIGEGVPDPKAIFGSTQGLRDLFGPERVMDMPLSENGMTGIGIGAALGGLRPIMVHQRVDFLYLAMDPLANVAAKWHYLFRQPVPMVVRTLIGRGWGQGPQHSQSLQALFGHIPGIKLVMPVTPQDAKGMLLAAIDDPNPVIFLEHRWLHGIQGHVPEEAYRVALDRGRTVREGRDVTIAAFSHMVLESLKAAEVLARFGIEATVIDMRVVQPLDMEPVLKSVRQTGWLLVADTGWTTLGMGAEVVARTVEGAFSSLKGAPLRIALPDRPAATAPALTCDYYPDAESIGLGIVSLLGRPLPVREIGEQLRWRGHRDQPNPEFTGPF
ncbi:MAG: dehydrogenase [Magnetococcales bacterium]|nr:dehydrogenase [Magnetococcales bacterium]